MNNKNLAKVAGMRGRDIDEHGRYAVADGNPRLYCDGHMICVAESLDVKELKIPLRSGKTLDMQARATEMFRSFLECDQGDVIAEGILVGSLHDLGYARLFSRSIVIQERFRRCFDVNAEFRGVSVEKAVTVYEGGALKGVVMPVKVDPELWPEVPYLADDVLYHECECICGGC